MIYLYIVLGSLGVGLGMYIYDYFIKKLKSLEQPKIEMSKDLMKDTLKKIYERYQDVWNHPNKYRKQKEK